MFTLSQSQNTNSNSGIIYYSFHSRTFLSYLGPVVFFSFEFLPKSITAEEVIELSDGAK